MINKIYFDVDGVLLDWVRPFLNYGGSETRYDELKKYDLSYLFHGNTKLMVECINRFNSSDDYRNLPALTTREQLLKLKDAGYQLNIITQVDGEQARKYRQENLDNVFGKDMFTNIIMVGRGTKKAELLNKLHPNEEIYVVEDNPQFFVDIGYDYPNIRGLAVVHPYNRAELKNFVPKYTDVNEVIRHLLLCK